MRTLVLAVVTATISTAAAHAQQLLVHHDTAPPAPKYTYAAPMIWLPFNPSPVFVPSLVVFRYGQYYTRRTTSARRTHTTYEGPYFRP